MRKFVALSILFFSVFVSSYSQETLTLTTYYPSPFGVYNELRAKRMAIGANYYDQSQYCWGATCPNEIKEGMLNDVDLVVEGKAFFGSHDIATNARVAIESQGAGIPSGLLIRGNESNQAGFGRAGLQFFDNSTDTAWNVFATGTASVEGPYKLHFNLGHKDGTVLKHNLLMFDGVTENVGVGFGSGSGHPQAKLDVAGGVKIGYHDTCSATGEDNGLIRYDSTNKAMEYCQDGVWNAMGASRMHMAKMVRSVAQAIPDGGHHKINLNNEIFDYGNIAFPGNGNFVIQRAGIYLVTASWRCGGFSRSHLQAGDSEMGAFVYVNGVALGQSDAFVKGPVNETGYAIVQDTYKFNQGDVIDLRVSHTAGGDRNTQTGVDNRPRMSIVQLR
jgi:hypothetical protein